MKDYKGTVKITRTYSKQKDGEFREPYGTRVAGKKRNDNFVGERLAASLARQNIGSDMNVEIIDLSEDEYRVTMRCKPGSKRYRFFLEEGFVLE